MSSLLLCLSTASTPSHTARVHTAHIMCAVRKRLAAGSILMSSHLPIASKSCVKRPSPTSKRTFQSHSSSSADGLVFSPQKAHALWRTSPPVATKPGICSRSCPESMTAKSKSLHPLIPTSPDHAARTDKRRTTCSCLCAVPLRTAQRKEEEVTDICTGGISTPAKAVLPSSLTPLSCASSKKGRFRRHCGGARREGTSLPAQVARSGPDLSHDSATIPARDATPGGAGASPCALDPRFRPPRECNGATTAPRAQDAPTAVAAAGDRPCSPCRACSERHELHGWGRTVCVIWPLMPEYRAWHV